MLRSEVHGTDIPNARPAETIGALATPALLLDKDRLDRNLGRMSSRMAPQTALRRHDLRVPSIQIARIRGRYEAHILLVGHIGAIQARLRRAGARYL